VGSFLTANQHMKCHFFVPFTQFVIVMQDDDDDDDDDEDNDQGC